MQQDKSEQAKLIQELYDLDKKNHLKQFTEVELRKAFRSGHAVGVYLSNQMTDELEDKFVNELIQDRNEAKLLLINDNHLEISDEEILIGLKDSWGDYEYDNGNLYSTTYRDGWVNAIKWYREQLKKK